MFLRVSSRILLLFSPCSFFRFLTCSRSCSLILLSSLLVSSSDTTLVSYSYFSIIALLIFSRARIYREEGSWKLTEEAWQLTSLTALALMCDFIIATTLLRRSKWSSRLVLSQERDFQIDLRNKQGLQRPRWASTLLSSIYRSQWSEGGVGPVASLQSAAGWLTNIIMSISKLWGTGRRQAHIYQLQKPDNSTSYNAIKMHKSILLFFLIATSLAQGIDPTPVDPVPLNSPSPSPQTPHPQPRKKQPDEENEQTRRNQELEAQRRAQMQGRSNFQEQKTGGNRTHDILMLEVKARSSALTEMRRSGLKPENSQMFNFELGSRVEQFTFHYIVEMPVNILLRSYNYENGIYGPIKDMERSGPITVEVRHQDSGSVLASNSFYFFGQVKILAQKNTTYLLRVSSSGSHKMIETQMPRAISLVEFNGLYKKDKGLQHIQDVRELSGILEQKLAQMRKGNALGFVNSRMMKRAMRKYSIYQFVEMIILVAFTVGQLQFIRSMFRNESIL